MFIGQCIAILLAFVKSLDGATDRAAAGDGMTGIPEPALPCVPGPPYAAFARGRGNPMQAPAHEAA